MAKMLSEISEADLRRMNRAELLEMLVVQSRQVKELTKENEAMRRELAQRQITVERAGSIAEASLALTAVFQEAQRAADLYLENIRRLEAQTRQRAEAENA